jgi:hypothetical protein
MFALHRRGHVQRRNRLTNLLRRTDDLALRVRHVLRSPMGSLRVSLILTPTLPLPGLLPLSRLLLTLA